MPTVIETDIVKVKQQSDGTTLTPIDVNVVAVYNPVIIELQRKDFSGTTVLSAWDSTNLSINLGSLASEVEVGDFITTGTVGRREVLNKTGNIITFDFPHSVMGNITTYFNIESRLNWYLSLRIECLIPSEGYQTIRLTPDETGLMRAEISGAMRSFMSLEFGSEFVVSSPLQIQQFNQSKIFKLNWTEYWIGSSEEITDNTALYHGIAGAFQLGDPNDGYYIEYYANLFGNSGSPELLPNWLTEFEKPVCFAGYPFTVSFLPNADLGNLNEYSLLKMYKKADGTISNYNEYAFSTFLIPNNVLRLNLAKLSGEITDPDLDVSLDVGVFLTDDYTYILKPLKIRYVAVSKQNCNTFYVRWINTLGGWDYWLFERKIYETDKVESGGTFVKYFDSIADSSSVEDYKSKPITPQVQVGCEYLSINDAKGLRSLKTSPKVEWYNEDTATWIGVRVDAGSFLFRTDKNNYGKLDLTINLPQRFNQFA